MSDRKWFSDTAARNLHALMEKELAGFIERLCPSHELSHFGIHRNEHTEEVILKLHLNPIGTIRVVPESDSDFHILPRLNNK